MTTKNKPCATFSPLVNGGDYRGTLCAYCGEKESAHNRAATAPTFDRFDICEAYAVLEWDWNKGGWLRERPSNWRRREATACQLKRLRFRPRPSLGGYESLTENGKAIYDAACSRLGLYHQGVYHV